jgi:hypothetical protein
VGLTLSEERHPGPTEEAVPGRLASFDDAKVECSVGITNYNGFGTIERPLGSLLFQVDESFEIVVVDSMSVDGSFEFFERPGVRLIREKCSRGRGRQIAVRPDVNRVSPRKAASCPNRESRGWEHS